MNNSCFLPIGHDLSPGHCEQTPFLLMDYPAVELQLDRLSQAFPGVDIHYAVKCNTDSELLRVLHRRSCGFEIASYAELTSLMEHGVAAADVLFSNPVKRPMDVRRTSDAGVWRFAFDSARELRKIAEHAPGAAVYLRISTPKEASVVASEGKFGVDAEEAVALLQYAKRLGLRPYGLTFHVGSQMTDVSAWNTPIRRCAEVMNDLRKVGIRLSMIDIGGGLPVAYDKAVPSISAFGEQIMSELQKLPYAVKLVMEPGRSLVAESGVLVASVIGVARRHGRRWVHLDVGAFNGLMESLETQNSLRFPVRDSKRSERTESSHLTGPSCDSQDTILFNVELSSNLDVDDTVYIGNAGAYTTSYASNFNGFAIPSTRDMQDLTKPLILDVSATNV